MKKLALTLVALLMVIVMATRAIAEPCNAIMVDELPCEIVVGDPAPYSGTLMTKSTAYSLQDKVFEVKKLRIALDALQLSKDTMAETYEIRIVDLKVQLEDAPRPLLEQPVFWIVAGVALIAGFATGWTLAPRD